MLKDKLITEDMNPIHMILRRILGGAGGSMTEHLYLVDETENQLVMENNDELIRR